jgi:hypothetical protein
MVWLKRLVKKSERALTNIEYEEIKERILTDYIEDKDMEEIADKLKADDQSDPYIKDLWGAISSSYRFYLNPVFIIKYWNYLDLSEVGKKVRNHYDERYSNYRWTEIMDHNLYAEIGDDGYLSLLSIMPVQERKRVINNILYSYSGSGNRYYKNISFSSNFINYCKPYLDEEVFFRHISGFDCLTEDFIEENIKKIEQGKFFYYYNIKDDFLLKIKDSINEDGMNAIMEKSKLKSETLEELFDSFTEETIRLSLLYQRFSDEFIQKNIDKMDIELVFKYQPISNKTVQMFIKKYGNKIIYLLRENSKSNLTEDFIEENKETISLRNILIYHKVSDNYFIQTYKEFKRTDEFEYDYFYSDLFGFQKFSKKIMKFLLEDIKGDDEVKKNFLYYQEPDEQFVLENADLIGWSNIFSSMYIKHLSNDFIIAHQDEIPWNFANWRPGNNGESLASLDEEVLWELRNNFNQEHWDRISQDSKLSPQFILGKAFDYINLRQLKRNQSIDLNEMRKYKVFDALAKRQKENV